jgi:hypothetical protein
MSFYEKMQTKTKYLQQLLINNNRKTIIHQQQVLGKIRDVTS